LKKIKLTFGAGMDELACVHALDGHEVLCSLLVSVCVSESDLGEWGASSGIVNDVLDNTLDVPTRLAEIAALTLVSQRNRES
jgi:hypothetical protein